MDPAEATGEYIGATLIEPGAAGRLADALEATCERDPAALLRGRLPGTRRPRRADRRGADRRGRLGRGRQPRRPRQARTGDRVPVLSPAASPRRSSSTSRRGRGRRPRRAARRPADRAPPGRVAVAVGAGPGRPASRARLAPALGERRGVPGRRRHGRRRRRARRRRCVRAPTRRSSASAAARPSTRPSTPRRWPGIPMVAVATNLSHDGICSPVGLAGARGGQGLLRRAHAARGRGRPRLSSATRPRRWSAPGSATWSATCPPSRTGSSATPEQRRADRRPGRRHGPHRGRGGARHRRRRSATTSSSPCWPRRWCCRGSPCRRRVDSGPSSGGCHEILHAFDQLFPGAANHGELAGLGARLRYLPARGRTRTSRRSPTACAGTGCRSLPADSASPTDEFAEAVHATRPPTRPGRYTILEHLDLSDDRDQRRVRGLCPGHR